MESSLLQYDEAVGQNNVKEIGRGRQERCRKETRLKKERGEGREGRVCTGEGCLPGSEVLLFFRCGHISVP